MPRPLIHQMELLRRLVLKGMYRVLRQQQWPFERPGGDALPIQLVQQPRVVGVGAFLISACAVTAPQLVLKTRAFTFV